MENIDRRSALALLGCVAATFAAARPAAADAMDSGSKDTTPFPGVVQRSYGSTPSLIPAYKTVSMRDLIMQPGSKTAPNAAMKNDMVCHVTQGELRLIQNDQTFTAKTGYVWTCAKGTIEQAFNDGTVVGIMRITDLLA
jgi:hypothetical protein